MSFDNAGIDYSNYMPPVTPQGAVSVTTEGVKTRQAEEVKAAIFMAKQFPRDQQAAFNRIMMACQRKKLAEEAEYEFPRGGSKVNGPSIRLAEVLAQSWGNIDYGLIELEQKSGESQVMAYAWDIETNTRRQMTFAVKHERKAGGSIKRLEDPRDIYELVANNGARRMRACILGVIPGDIVDAALDQCKKTLVSGYTEPLADRVRSALHQFKEKFGVTKEQIEKYMGCSADSFTENDYLRIGGVWKALRDGMAKREDYFEFGPSRGSTTEASKTEEAFLQAKAAKQKSVDGGDDNGATGQSELPFP
ncbi:hypothetical protein [Paenibacillus pinisoli]|uniref:hypothetical protein n=1 Tax=Paenibacillus pinisoli TaxID=1276110 RepID=UPI001A9EA595|nr:hypothetical protein [Paenibacillus pinisoli]